MGICTAGSVREEGVNLGMVDLNGHEAGNGGHSQGTYSARACSARYRRDLSPQICRRGDLHFPTECGLHPA
jgi:hypothetical protein